MIGWERIMGLLDTPMEVHDSPSAGELAILRGEVSFEHVSFHYSDDPAPILTDIDLHIRPGETVALVGDGRGQDHPGQIAFGASITPPPAASLPTGRICAWSHRPPCAGRWVWYCRTRSCSTARSWIISASGGWKPRQARWKRPRQAVGCARFHHPFAQRV